MKDTELRLTVSAVTVDAPEPASCSVLYPEPLLLLLAQPRLMSQLPRLATGRAAITNGPSHRMFVGYGGLFRGQARKLPGCDA